MGWSTGCYKNWKTIQEFFEQSFISACPDKVEYKVLRAALVNFKEAYAAIKRIDKETGEEIVFAATYLMHFEGNYHYGYKSMDETCGPGMYNCPEKILKLLTPTTSEYAISWRESNWKRINDKKEKKKNCKPYEGMIVRLNDKWVIRIDNLSKKGLLVSRLTVDSDSKIGYFSGRQYLLSFKQFYNYQNLSHLAELELYAGLV